MHLRLTRVTVICLVALLPLFIVLVLAPRARAAQLIDRGATNVQFAVNAKGEALVTYRAQGKLRRVLVWGAVNALAPSSARPQVHFRIDYAGGWGKYHRDYWRGFKNGCRHYDGPALFAAVAACKAPDGSYWALQSWHEAWPDLGFVPWLASLAEPWLLVSHWTGQPATLEAYADWIYSGRFHHLFGRYSYRGQPVYGFGTTRFGAPTDSYGRLVFIDTQSSLAYGPGWHRENSFVPHGGTGVWCYGFYSFDPTQEGYQFPPGYEGGARGPGVSTLYRLVASGPGVTPDVSLTIADPGQWDASDPAKVSFEKRMNAIQDTMMAADQGGCRQH